MGLVLSDVGADQILNAYFNDSWPVSKNLKIRLFTNDYTPVDTSILSNFTEAAGGGYAAKNLTNGSWTVFAANDPSDAVYPKQTWTFTGPLTGSATIYGYYIEDNAGNSGVYIWGERLGASFKPANNTDQLGVIPKFELSKGVPT